MSDKKGLIYIITGAGKGKTTQALGLALRSSGWDKKVLIVQFCKPQDYQTGEKLAINNLKNITIKGCGTCNLWGEGMPTFPKGEEAKKEVSDTFDFAVRSTDNYDVIVLDEILYALKDNLIDIDKIIEFLKSKPEEIDIILTGRDAPEKILEFADIASEIRVLRYKREKRNIKGIDY